MLDKFFIWVGRNRKEIGLTIGGLNLLSGISAIFNGGLRSCHNRIYNWRRSYS